MMPMRISDLFYSPPLEMHQQILSIFLLFFMLLITVSGVLLFEFFVNILGDFAYKRLRNKYSYGLVHPVMLVTSLAFVFFTMMILSR